MADIWADSINGNDANPGTEDRPVATLQWAVDSFFNVMVKL
jgi:hypothetical protein